MVRHLRKDFYDLSLTSAVQQLPRRTDLTTMPDPTWIAKALTGMPRHVTQENGAGTGWRGMGTKVEVAVLGEKAE